MSEPARTGGGWVEFEWAVVRVVPRVHLEEFVNVGVVVHARTVDYLAARIEPPWQRLQALSPELDIDAVRRHLATFETICNGDADGGPIALLPPSERFHWLTAPRSAIVQTSERRPGRTHDPAAELQRLFREQCPRAPASPHASPSQ